MPDNLLGGLLLSIVSMAVGFIVLGFLALVIKVVAKAVQTAETSRNAGAGARSPDVGAGEEGSLDEGRWGDETAPAADSNASQQPSGGAGVTGLGCAAGAGCGFAVRAAKDASGSSVELTVEERVAVIAAVMAAMAGTGRRRVFVRGLRDSGAWGKLGKAHAVYQGRARR
ncbi:MAG: OadG family protein [Firmicutes bacterium]|nr:OadG family protein [Candidatus Fermentithermobacillaceae bacterium]